MNPYVNLFGRSVDLKEFQLSCELSFFFKGRKESFSRSQRCNWLLNYFIYDGVAWRGQLEGCFATKKKRHYSTFLIIFVSTTESKDVGLLVGWGGLSHHDRPGPGGRGRQRKQQQQQQRQQRLDSGKQFDTQVNPSTSFVHYKLHKFPIGYPFKLKGQTDEELNFDG